MSSEHAEARDDCREGRMTAALKPPSLLHTATGEPPLGRNAEFFAGDQDEIFEHDNPRHRSSLTRMGVLELEGGKWLTKPPSFHTNVPPFNSRAETLHFAMSAMIRRAGGDGEGTRWTKDYADAVICWAQILMPACASSDKPERLLRFNTA
jgi:hypothetical protein